MQTFDPTTNRIPFGLLTPEEQKTLKEWPHGWELYFGEYDWFYTEDPSWIKEVPYRGLPAPIIDTYYVNVYADGDTGFSYMDKEHAVRVPTGIPRAGIIQLKITGGKLVSVNITD